MLQSLQPSAGALPRVWEGLHLPGVERQRYPEAIWMNSSNGQRSFRLEYDPKLCLYPDQITQVQGTFAAQMVDQMGLKKIWELGVGSGVFLSQLLLDSEDPAQLQVKGFDIDRNALGIAGHNLKRLSHQMGLRGGSYSLSQGDWLSRERLPKRPDVDLIYANPPYLPPDTPVRPEFEENPSHALFAPENGMQHFRTIMRQSQLHLKPGGYLFLRTSKKPELAAAVQGMAEAMMPASNIEPMHFQSGHREGVGLMIRYYPAEI